MKYYKNSEDDLFVDPIVENHEGLVEIDKQEFDEILAVKNTPAPEDVEAAVRGERNAKLAQSDWIVAVSYERGEPVPQDWADYRQALRDITDQAGFPYSVEWPTKPE